ncbi:tetratricopeptide repeat protein [Haliovirga abyssi]|uniref:Tetratricopeptide repeat protein n=1 Tax=Haliovirga abyssi TaxID=2996794 RepID=A0AAU9DRJ9_9FUSO|nr:hypothetical protein [Haliovirga abyssi]BDU49569.1 hypothetical protein HLVA_01380 [Haliovirga abyssi]
MTIIKNLIFLGIGVAFIFFSGNYMMQMDNKLKNEEYHGEKGKSTITVNFKLMGMKRFGSDVLWIKQVLDTGSFDYGADRIKKNSEAVSYLDPYFIGNYYFSGTVVALIKKYKRYDYGLEILGRGLKYNPKDKYLKNYISGIVAASKGDIEGVLKEFERILKTHRDDRMIHTVAFIYEEKYKKTKEIKYLKKAIGYWKRLEESKDENYRKIAVVKLGKLEEVIGVNK